VSEKRIYRNHSDEFKAEAVRMVMKGHRRTEVARNLGISVTLLDTWVKKHKERGRPSYQKNKSAEEKIRALERELERTRMERDILKKALGYFANEKE
jgi:transposase